MDSRQLAMGMKVEREHTTDPVLRKAISKDHLAEDPKYYTHLREMERKYAMYRRAYDQGVNAVKQAFQITDDDKSLGDKVTPFLGAIDPTPMHLGTGLASAAMAPEGSRLAHGAGAVLGGAGGSIVGGLGGGLLGAILGLPVGALLGLKLPKGLLSSGMASMDSAGAGALIGGRLGAIGGGIAGGYKGTQLGRRIAGGKKKNDAE